MPNPKSSERWLSIGIRTTMPWPTMEVGTEYQSFVFKMLPETDAFLPTLAVEFATKKNGSEEALKVLRRFMTAVSWQEGHGLRESGWCCEFRSKPTPHSV